MSAEAVTREEIEQYLALETERKALARQVDNRERAAAPLKKKLRAWVEAHGGADRTCVHFGYVLALLARAGVPRWKDEFLRVAGLEETEQVAAAAPPTYTLNVEPASVTPTFERSR